MRCSVSFVSATETRSISIDWERKLCRDVLSDPEYQEDGNDPSGSPVPGTMYPVSRFDHGVSRGENVYVMVSIPIDLQTRATARKFC